jgi:hypothetical protein
MRDILYYQALATHAFRWAEPRHPFAAHPSLRPFMTMVPKDQIGDPVPVDREFWLGEVLDEIRRDAERHLPWNELLAYEWFVADKMAAMDRGRRIKIPVLGEGKPNPPRVYRAQKVIAKLEKEPRPIRPSGIVVNPEQLVSDVLVDYLDGRATEVFLILFVNVRNQIVGYNEYAEGSVSGVSVHPSGILRDALTSGSAAFITVHQHPTGDPTPSPQDRELWKRLRDAGELVGIPVLDNLVIGDDGSFYSESAGPGKVSVASRRAAEGASS